MNATEVYLVHAKSTPFASELTKGIDSGTDFKEIPDILHDNAPCEFVEGIGLGCYWSADYVRQFYSIPHSVSTAKT